MSDRPSFMTSTFSIMCLIVLISYCGLCVYLKDIGNLKEVVLILLGAYGLKKGNEMQNGAAKPNGNA